MVTDRRVLAGHRAMAVARAYELHRGASVVDVAAGTTTATEEISAAFTRLAKKRPVRPSADLVSTLGDEIRVIEVKGRGSSGPVQLPERELDTLACAGQAGFLYVVWNTTQSHPDELWVVRDPARLDWVEDQPAARPQGAFRGVRHEARYVINSARIERAGERIDLTFVQNLPTKPA
ncbi:protein NO VEIN domain-containing protein [Nocardiopsis lambiniae]|uniref:Protein NO VEIN C-terminal domain-containing protein n=1 Tax=Nocardiopsis lambiniae TaxID=3075539 RepID=A0ABU2M4Y2_9ACTN|nr:DUF3883 domain-containing protein [Nocardiopsis sp. DSM 44743]MDT0327066.1 hypothetical protein [Nocardiopsis sp. DSM 44743]